MSKPFTRADLDHVHCSVPGCTTEHAGGNSVFLHGRCHVGAGNEVEYVDGLLHIRCTRCKREVAAIQVAEGPVME